MAFDLADGLGIVGVHFIRLGFVRVRFAFCIRRYDLPVFEEKVTQFLSRICVVGNHFRKDIPCPVHSLFRRFHFFRNVFFRLGVHVEILVLL